MITTRGRWASPFRSRSVCVRRGLRSGIRNLFIAKDRANIQQSLHQIEHLLATSLRTIDQSFMQYEAFRDARQAGKENLEVQVARVAVGMDNLFLNFLQGLTDWGNAVASEAQALATYNGELANLERQTGTILETHGIRFIEEQFTSIGYSWSLFRRRMLSA